MDTKDQQRLEELILALNSQRIPEQTIPRTPDEIRVDSILRKMHNEEA